MGENLAGAMHGQAGSGSLELAGISHALARRKVWIIGTTLACLLASTAFVSLVKSRYTAEAKVLIENQEGYFTRPEKAGVSDPSTGPDPEAVLSQVQLMQSRDLARNVIRELGLVGNKEFDPQAEGGSFISRLLELAGLKRSVTDRTPEDRVLETYFLDLSAFPVPKSRVVSIEFTSNDPDMSARAANTIADQYINVQSKTKRDTARQVSASLETLISSIKLQLAEAESKAEKFRLQSGLLVGANNLTITAQQLGDINAQLTSARSAQAETQAKARLIRDMLKQGRLSEVPDIANNDLIRRIKEQQVTLRAQLALEARTLLPGHPRIKELSAQIADLDNNLRLAADKTARTLENDAKIGGSRVENLAATLESQKKVAGVANSDDVTMRQYDSQTRLLKEQLEANSAKYQEAVARQNAISTPADARVVSRAVAPPVPVFPKKVPIIVMSTLAGLIFSAGGIIAAEFMSEPARSPVYPLPLPVPVPAEPVAPLLATPPRRRKLVEAADAGPAADQPEAAATPAAPELAVRPLNEPVDSMSALAAKIGLASPSGQSIVSLVTTPDDPKAAVDFTIALARTLASHHRTILVNLDIHAGEIDRLVSDEAQNGLVDLLGGHCSFAEAIHRDSATRLHVLAHGRTLVEAGEGLDNILDALCETYDHVVLAIPPVPESSLALALAPYADHAILVTSAPASPAASAAHAALAKANAGEVLLVEGVSAARPARDREFSMRR